VSHVHDQDAGLMELLDDFAWWDANGRHEETRLFLDDHVDKFRQLAMCIIMLDEARRSSSLSLRLHETTYASFARAATDLWKEQVDTKCNPRRLGVRHAGG